MSEFEGKSVIVTGSSPGIGECTAVLFAGRGANVTVCGREESKIQNVLDKCRTASRAAGHRNKFIGVAGDMGDSAHRQDVIDKTVSAFGQLDVLVANHGAGKMTAGLEDITEEDFDHVFNINNKSVLFLIKAAVKHLEHTKGCIVVNSSIASTLASNQMVDYFMSKAALDHMVRCLALELGPKGIRINCINPTVVRTQFLRDSKEDFYTSEVGLFIAKSHPLGGRISQPEEQADVVVFLAGAAARFITGQCIKVDGGISVKGQPSNYYVPSSKPTTEPEKKTGA